MSKPHRPAAVVYGYCRVSFEKTDSVSIESQEQQIRAYHAHKFPALTLVIVQDRGVSGRIKLLDRPAGKTLEKMRPGDHLVVTKVDRAFRSIADGATLIDALHKRSIGVHCLDVQIDTSTPTGRAMLHMLMTFAQLERERISERFREAAAYRRSQGECMHTPAMQPIGWRVTGVGKSRRYQIDAEDRRHCRRATRMHAAGKSLREIAEISRDTGWKTRRGFWSETTLLRCIRAAKAGFPIDAAGVRIASR